MLKKVSVTCQNKTLIMRLMITGTPLKHYVILGSMTRRQVCGRDDKCHWFEPRCPGNCLPTSSINAQEIFQTGGFKYTG